MASYDAPPAPDRSHGGAAVSGSYHHHHHPPHVGYSRQQQQQHQPRVGQRRARPRSDSGGGETSRHYQQHYHQHAQHYAQQEHQHAQHQQHPGAYPPAYAAFAGPHDAVDNVVDGDHVSVASSSAHSAAPSVTPSAVSRLSSSVASASAASAQSGGGHYQPTTRSRRRRRGSSLPPAARAAGTSSGGASVASAARSAGDDRSVASSSGSGRGRFRPMPSNKNSAAACDASSASLLDLDPGEEEEGAAPGLLFERGDGTTPDAGGLATMNPDRHALQSRRSNSGHHPPPQHHHQPPPQRLNSSFSGGVGLALSSAGASDATSLYGGGAEMVKRLLSAAARRREGTPGDAAVLAPAEAQQGGDGGVETAAEFARSAPRAGYLHKLGTNVKHYKRRFFVLRPSTHLYYFVSPNDAEPRGCIELDHGGGGRDEGSNIRELETLPDGRFRFEIVLDGGGGDLDASFASAANDAADEGKGRPRRIVLEARSVEAGREWIDSLRSESLPFVRSELESSRSEADALRARVSELEAKLEEMRLVESDRDGAVQDAREWKERHGRLNEGVGLLAGWVGRPPEDGEAAESKESADASSDGKRKENVGKEDTASVGAGSASEIKGGGNGSGGPTAKDEGEQPAEVTNDEEDSAASARESDTAPTRETDDGNGSPSTSSSPRLDLSALAGLADDDRALDDGLDRLAGSLGATQLPTLASACRRLRDNLRATSTEADTALRDLTAASRREKENEERMGRAERELCKLWEENCELRDGLKKTKKEKRLLVREVKSMREEQHRRQAETRREEEEQERREQRRGGRESVAQSRAAASSVARTDAVAASSPGPFGAARTAIPCSPRGASSAAEEDRPAPQDRPPRFPPHDPHRANVADDDAPPLPPPAPNDAQSTPVLRNGAKRGARAESSRKGAAGTEDERRLILELEEHVMAGLRLHEQLMTATKDPPPLHSYVDSNGRAEMADDMVRPPDGERGAVKAAELTAKPPLAELLDLPLPATASKDAAAVNPEDVDPASTVQKNRWTEAKGLGFPEGGGDLANETQSPICPVKLSLLDAADSDSDDDASAVEDRSVGAGMDRDDGGSLKPPALDGRSRGGAAGLPLPPRVSCPSTALPVQKLFYPAAAAGGGGGTSVNPPPVYPRGAAAAPVRLFQDDDEESTVGRPPSPDMLSQSSSIETSSTTGLGRRHPLLRLDATASEEEGADDDGGSVPSRFGAASARSESSSRQSVVTDTGSATARLACPLTDVIQTKQRQTSDGGSNAGRYYGSPGKRGEIYHLTFYSRKIGLQFQKVPAPASRRSAGSLTDAMMADARCSGADGGSDEGGVEGGSRDSNADLKRIAAIARRAHDDRAYEVGGDGAAAATGSSSSAACQVATPVDCVLVCGFHGFDDRPSSSGAGGSSLQQQRRPKLGARLVAFDGVSVEIGRWTFESVRKAIQSRGRPLTLSFRDDYLTMEQRAVLTRAVAETEAGMIQPKRTVPQYQMAPTAGLSSSAAAAAETASARHPAAVGDHVAKSVSQTSARDCAVGRGAPHQRAHSQTTMGRAYVRGTTPGNALPPPDNSHRKSFSDAGAASSVFSSSVLGPLVAGLMSGISSADDEKGGKGDATAKGVPFTPSYMRRNSDDAAAATPLDSIERHREFTSGLL